MSDALCSEVKNGIAVLTMHRAETGNAIDIAMADAILAAALKCDADDSIRCVILTGAGRMFCTGGDVKEFAAAGDGASVLISRLTASLHMAIARLTHMNKPLVTAINGAAAGAGFGLAMLGDVAIAARSAKFALAYGALGLTPDAAATWLLPRLVGLRQAQRLALLGEPIDAVQAERIGLVTCVVDDADLMAEARRVAETLARGPIGAFRVTRDLLNASAAASLEGQLEREAQALARSARGDEGREGIAAFASKRPPNFVDPLD